ncbi:hypothetical protein LR48_Vigan07g143100 [Vigna angularis]|uniref:Putative plant transposon protein domain-containing protein n=1 Tax=Phaseolus angularis TaxID=3914 RepID=A0A0L9UYR2_PHAAN|nr:hypothetical protein LR48_Vigan07g143100 [Vigna angularis]
MVRKAKLVVENNDSSLATYPTPTNIVVVKEFYTNARSLGDHGNEDYMSYVRGQAILYDPDSINRFLNTEWVGEQCQFALTMEERADFVDVESVLCVPRGHFQRNRNGAVVNIKRADLTRLEKYWIAFSDANIQPYSHVFDITISRAVLLYSMLRGMSINIGQVIANEIQVCANTMNNKGPLGHPSLITHDTRRPSTIGPITRGMIKKIQDEYSPKGQTLFAIFGWKIGEQEDATNLPKHGEGFVKLEEILQQFIQKTESSQKSTEAAIKNLKIQMGQITKQLEERPDTDFGANTEVNPRGECQELVSVNVEKVELEKEERKEREEKEEEKICVKIEKRSKLRLVELEPAMDDDEDDDDEFEDAEDDGEEEDSMTTWVDEELR